MHWPCLVRGAQRDRVGGMGRTRVVQLLDIYNIIYLNIYFEVYIQTQNGSAPCCWKTKFRRTTFLRCCRNVPVVHEKAPCYHAHHTRPTTKECELRVQPDRLMHVVWAVRRARSTARQRCTRA